MAFRFAVVQTSKVRACDDLKGSLTNRICTVETPIALPDWDLLAAMSLLISTSHPRRIGLSLKEMIHPLIKNLPLKPLDSHLTAIGLWNSQCKKRFAFLPRTLLFGATASVLHYNVFLRILAAVFNRLFGIPLIAFYDDMGSPMIWGLAEEALQLGYEVSALLGVNLNWGKCAWGARCHSSAFLDPSPQVRISGRFLYRLLPKKLGNGLGRFRNSCKLEGLPSPTCKS